MRKPTVKIGTKFRYNYADSNPEWKVIQARGRGTWICEVVETEMDYAGTQKCFSSEEIQASIGMSNFWKKTSDDSDWFYKSLKVGAIVHYHNGFGQYVRCQVTSDKDLLPLALVGDWREFDLPRRYPNGEVHLGYHVEQINKKKTLHPHASNIWEYSQDLQKKEDPRSLPPIDLSVPPMSEEESRTAKMVKVLESIHSVVEKWHELGPEGSLQRVRELVA